MSASHYVEAYSPNNQVAIFWDMNTCPIQGRGENLVRNINFGLSQIHERDSERPIYKLSNAPGHKFAFGNYADPIISKAVPFLVRQGFDFLCVKERKWYCKTQERCISLTPYKPFQPTPDFAMESFLLDYAIETRFVPPWNLLIASSDFDFSASMGLLGDNGYQVFLAKCQNSVPSFGDFAAYSWNWAPLQIGLGGLI